MSTRGIPDPSFDNPPTPPVSGDSSRSQSPLLTHNKFRPLSLRIQDRYDSKDPFFSFEFFPPRTANGALNLLARMERMSRGNPLFCDITWHSTGNALSTEPTSSLTFAMAMINHVGLNTMLHLTSCNQRMSDIDRHLARARDLGVSSLLLLRGDMPKGQEWNPETQCFKYAADIVRYTRDTQGDRFTIAVAGYPLGHPDARSYEEDLYYLKLKVDAGADFIITQLFFETDKFIKFVRDCREIGITCPILPGILPIQGYESLKHIAKLGGVPVPQHILDIVEPIKDNDDAVRTFGIEFATAMCREILASGSTYGLHFYTLNREVATLTILKNLGLWLQDLQKPLPWRPTANASRFHEDVRPIFWAIRPKSYVARTCDWEEFPNGRWGNSSAATFGDIAEHHLFYLKSKFSKSERLSMWGKQLIGEEDVWKVFYNFISDTPSDGGEKVSRIPWNEDNLAAETKLISPQLAQLNSKGVLTINSQPRANAEASTHAELGWGPPGGYVYQKAYLEFFVSAEKAKALKQIIHKYEPRVNYHIIKRDENEGFTNSDHLAPVAVTWGVFPGKEIVQPTVVDPVAFTFWKDEAFSIWQEYWGSLYPADSTSRKVIDHIVNNYYLVNLVDNDFIQDSILWKLCNEMLDVASSRTAQKTHVTDDGYDLWPQKVGRKFEEREIAAGMDLPNLSST